jgi:hypothetical protein
MVRFFLQIGNLIQPTVALMWLSLKGAQSAIAKMANIGNG